MDIKVKFFEDRFVEAIGPGIYGIYFQTNAENKELLYVGESVFVLVRCAAHLYEIVKGDGYLGFTKEIIESNNITLAFELLVSESDKKRRKANEKEIIKDRHPKMQSEISDRVKSIEDMIKEMTNLLNNTAPI
jgi:hypothetical protein